MKSVKKMVFSGLLLALGLLLPFLTGQIPQVGSRLLPMHLPVMLCGFLCGGFWGLLVGAVTPLLRSVLFGMPPMMPTAVAMAFELAAYGALCGLLHGRFSKKYWALYLVLALSMLGGRVVWGLASWALNSALGNAFGWQIFAAGAFVNALPGIVVQLIVIPPLVAALEKSGIAK